MAVTPEEIRRDLIALLTLAFAGGEKPTPELGEDIVSSLLDFRSHIHMTETFSGDPVPVREVHQALLNVADTVSQAASRQMRLIVLGAVEIFADLAIAAPPEVRLGDLLSRVALTGPEPDDPA